MTSCLVEKALQLYTGRNFYDSEEEIEKRQGTQHTPTANVYLGGIELNITTRKSALATCCKPKG